MSLPAFTAATAAINGVIKEIRDSLTIARAGFDALTQDLKRTIRQDMRFRATVNADYAGTAGL